MDPSFAAAAAGVRRSANDLLDRDTKKRDAAVSGLSGADKFTENARKARGSSDWSGRGTLTAKLPWWDDTPPVKAGG